MLKLQEIRVVVTQEDDSSDTYHVIHKNIQGVNLKPDEAKLLKRLMMKLGIGASILGDFDEEE